MSVTVGHERLLRAPHDRIHFVLDLRRKVLYAFLPKRRKAHEAQPVLSFVSPGWARLRQKASLPCLRYCCWASGWCFWLIGWPLKERVTSLATTEVTISFVVGQNVGER